MFRRVVKKVTGVATSDGAGVRLKRSLGTQALEYIDPFLLLDEFRSDDSADYIAGFPDHPHRGFETVTYMLAGAMEHQDNQGNQGHLGPGSVQWMTAGRGIVHSEMPKQGQGLMWGFQLWVNLPASLKMCEPRYQDIPPEAIPTVKTEGATIRVIAGTFHGESGPVRDVAVEPTYLDIALEPGVTLDVPLPRGCNAFTYTFEGGGFLGATNRRQGREVTVGEACVLSGGEIVRAVAGENGLRFLAIAGKPVNEPVARYGPFVMNTADEIRAAFMDYQQGKF